MTGTSSTKCEVAATRSAQSGGTSSTKCAIVVAVVVGLLGVGYLALPWTVSFAQGLTSRIEGPQDLVVDQYGTDGTHFVRYAHGQRFTVTVPLRNDGPLPATITDIRMSDQVSPLVETLGASDLPVTIDPGDTVPVTLTARFGNCRYYHERAVQTIPGAVVTGDVLGREFTEVAAFDHPLAVHSQVILDCPDRTLIRGDDIRGREPSPGRGIADG